MFSNLIPKERGSTRSAIQCFKGRHLQAGLKAVVVRELCIRNVLIPTLSKVYSTSSKHVFKDLIHTLCLSICLGVIGCAEVESGSQGFMQALPKSRRELRTSVGYYPFEHSKQANNRGHIQLCQLTISVGGLGWYEVCYFSQTVDHNPDGVIARLGPRQSSDKVHAYLFPLLLGNG